MAKIYRRGNKWGVDYFDPNGQRIRKIVSGMDESYSRVGTNLAYRPSWN